MNYIATNLVAILTAAGAGLAEGAVYHAFGRGKPGEAPNGAGPHVLRLLAVACIAEFWLAAILAGALILAPVEAGAWTVAIGTAIVIWIGFVVPVLAVTHRSHRMRLRVLFMDCVHWLVVMVTQAAVLHLIGLTRP